MMKSAVHQMTFHVQMRIILTTHWMGDRVNFLIIASEKFYLQELEE